MDVTEAIDHRLEVREYANRPASEGTKRAVLDAGRKAPSGKNTQHWRFLLVNEPGGLDALADHSPSGGWVADAAFAVVVCTDPDYHYHRFDAGRAITHMQFRAWADGVGSRLLSSPLARSVALPLVAPRGSCIYTGIDDAAVRDYFGVPDEYAVTAVVGFGYPEGSGRGRKRRKPLGEVAFRGRFGEPVEE
jgi:nitroreductase